MGDQISGSLENLLRQKFSAFVSRRGASPPALVEVIRAARQRGLTVFAFGGIPRGVLHNGKYYQPRDLDLVFDDQHFQYFESIFERFIQRRNSYGGLRLRIQNMSVDAWPLSATWAFRTGVLLDPSFEKLPSTTFLNADGVIVELSPDKGRSRRIYESGFFSAWSRKVLDINLRDNPFPTVCVARTLSISRRFGFRLSNRLATYLWETLAALPMDDFLQTQMKHYGQIEFSESSLRRIFRKLEKHHSTHSLSPIALFPVRADQLEMPFTKESSEVTEEPEVGFFDHDFLDSLTSCPYR